MLKNLSQIMVTILAIGAGFMGAYLVYLLSMKSNITAKIEEEGYIISSFLEKHREPLFYAFSGMGNRIINLYLNKFPEYSRLDLVDEVLKDAEELISDPSKKDNIKTFQNYFDDDLPFAGRLFVFALDEYFQALFPPKIKKKGLGYSYPYSYGQDDYGDELLFPYGQKGVDEWIKEFERINAAIKIRMVFLYNFRNHLNLYLKKIEDPQLRKTMERRNYQRWISDSIADIRRIEASVMRIYSLKTLIGSYSIKERIPNLFSIFVCFLLALLIGVVAPLLIEGRSEISVLNILIVISSMSFVFAAGYYTFKDIIPAKDEDYALKMKMYEICEYMDNIREGLNGNTFVSFEKINGLLKGPYKDKIEEGLSQSLKEITKGLKIYNKCITNLGKAFFDEISKHPRISKNIVDEKGGGRFFSITDFLTNNNLNGRITKNMTWVFEVPIEQFKRKEIRIGIPSEEEEYQHMLVELKQLKDKMQNDSEYQECINNYQTVIEKIEKFKKKIDNT
jgi:hypothetical protein